MVIEEISIVKYASEILEKKSYIKVLDVLINLLRVVSDLLDTLGVLIDVFL